MIIGYHSGTWDRSVLQAVIHVRWYGSPAAVSSGPWVPRPGTSERLAALGSWGSGMRCRRRCETRGTVPSRMRRQGVTETLGVGMAAMVVAAGSGAPLADAALGIESAGAVHPGRQTDYGIP